MFSLSTLSNTVDVLQAIGDWFLGTAIYRALKGNGGFILSLAIFTLIVIWVGEKIIKLSIERALNPKKNHKSITKLESRRRTATVLTVVRTFWRILVLAMALSVLVYQLNLPSGPITAVLGGLGVALGFGARDLVQDIINGIFILAEDQFKIGDYISVMMGSVEYEGTVENITIRRTVLRDVDGDVHHVPNSVIRVATNQTSGFSRMVVKLKLSNDVSLTKVEVIINKSGEEFYTETVWSKKLKEAPTMARVSDFEESGIEITVWARTIPGNQWKAASEFRKKLKEDLDKNKIKLG